MRFILFGPPGSGKGTQADLIEKKYGFPKISAGDLLRQAVKTGSLLGKKAKVSMNRGQLVSDEIVTEIVRQRISRSDCQRGYVLDGFPRNIYQAQIIDKLKHEEIEVAIEICLSDKILFERLESRRICPHCWNVYNINKESPDKEATCDVCNGKLTLREDDNPEVVKERLRIFREHKGLLADYYKKKKVYHTVDGNAKVDTVFSTICAIIDKKISRSIEMEAVR